MHDKGRRQRKCLDKNNSVCVTRTPAVWMGLSVCVTAEWQMELVTESESKAIMFTQEALLAEFVLTRLSAKRRSRYSSLNTHTYAWTHSNAQPVPVNLGADDRRRRGCVTGETENRPITPSTMTNLFVHYMDDRQKERRKTWRTVMCWPNCALHETAADTHTLSHSHTHTNTLYSSYPPHKHTQLWHKAHPSSVWGNCGLF